MSLRQYAVNEANNLSLGQAGALLVTGTTAVTCGAGSGVFVAIQFVEDTVFDSSDATTADENWPTDAQGGPGTNSDPINQKTMPAGMTIYGRWKTVAFDSGAAFLYLGA